MKKQVVCTFEGTTEWGSSSHSPWAAGVSRGGLEGGQKPIVSAVSEKCKNRYNMVGSVHYQGSYSIRLWPPCSENAFIESQGLGYSAGCVGRR